MSAGVASVEAGAPVTLRPMSLGEILDRTFQIYRSRFWVCVAIGATPAAIMLLLHMGDLYWWRLSRLAPSYRPQGLYAWNALVSLGYYHVAIVAHVLFSAAIVHQASKTAFGETCSARTSLRFAFARWRSFLWLGVIVLGLVLIGSEAITAGLFAGIGSAMDALKMLGDGNNAAIVVLLLLPSLTGIVLFFWLTGCCAFLLPSCVIESLRGRKALRRSWTLSREARWKVSSTFLLLMVLALILGFGVQAAWRWIAVLIWNAWPSERHFVNASYQPSVHAISAMLGMVFHPLYTIAATLFYYDQRIRKEGFDIEHLMQTAGLVPDAGAAMNANETAPSESAQVAAEEAGA